MRYCSICGTRKDLNVHQRLDGRKFLCTLCSDGTPSIAWKELTRQEKVAVAHSRTVHLSRAEKEAARG